MLKRCWNVVPFIGGRRRADHQAHRVVGVVVARVLLQQDRDDAADVVGLRAVPAPAVVPQLARRETLDDHRLGIRQDGRADRDALGVAVEERQARVQHVVVGIAGVLHRFRPDVVPVVVAELDALRHAGRARRVEDGRHFAVVHDDVGCPWSWSTSSWTRAFRVASFGRGVTAGVVVSANTTWRTA